MAVCKSLQPRQAPPIAAVPVTTGQPASGGLGPNPSGQGLMGRHPALSLAGRQTVWARSGKTPPYAKGISQCSGHRRKRDAGSRRRPRATDERTQPGLSCGQPLPRAAIATRGSTEPKPCGALARSSLRRVSAGLKKTRPLMPIDRRPGAWRLRRACHVSVGPSRRDGHYGGRPRPGPIDPARHHRRPWLRPGVRGRRLPWASVRSGPAMPSRPDRYPWRRV